MFNSIKSSISKVCLSFIVVFSVSGNALANSNGAHAPDSKSDAMTLMLKYDAKFVETFNRGDAAEITDLYTEDAIQSESNMVEPLSGKAAIKAAMEKYLEESTAHYTLSTEVFTAHDLGNGYIAANGRWEMHDKQGARIRGGLWSNVFKVVGSDLLMFRESTNLN
jgi:ketosteroid isomerase-like protein